MKNLIIFNFLLFCTLHCKAQNTRFHKYFNIDTLLNYTSNPVFKNDTSFICLQNVYNPKKYKSGIVNTLFNSLGDTLGNKYFIKDSCNFYGPNKLIRINNNAYTICQYIDPSFNKPQFIFIKINLKGDTIIEKIFGDYNSWDVSFDLIADSHNNILQTGALTVAGDGYNTNHQFIMKLDTNGNVLWQKDLGINGKNTYGNGIIETPNHDYIVNGYIDHKASLPTVWITNKQYFVTLTDSAGNIKWQKQYGNATQNEIGTGIINCNTGCYLLGYQDSAAQLSAPPWFYEETIGMVNFIDKNGNLQWQKKYIDTTYETKLLNGFAIKGNEYVLLANKTRMGYDVTFNNNEPTIIKIDSVGNVKWKRQYYIDDSVNIDPHLITLCPDSGYMVNGFVNFTKSNRLADAYLLKVDKFGCLQANCQQWDGVEEVVYHPANEIGQLLVYPNPAGNQLTVGSNQYSVNTIEVTNVLGQVCISIINYKSEIINVAALPSGIYFIKATDNKGNVMNGKFVKE